MNRRGMPWEGSLGRPWRFPFLLPLGIACASVLSALPGLSAQIVQGHLNDARTRFAIGEVEVELRDSTGSVVARTITNYLGSFQIAAPGPGRYSLLVKAMGYRSTDSESFEVREGEVSTVDLFLRPEPMELDTLMVQSRRRRVLTRLQEQGFYERQRVGAGTFLTPEQIRRWPALTVGDVLRHAPFVHVESGGIQGSRILISKYGRCAPTIYVDGTRIQGFGGNNPEDWARPEDIVAVEVYRGTAEIPLEWGMNETCGVILIWTKVFRREG